MKEGKGTRMLIGQRNEGSGKARQKINALKG
jgi:hypothetical protein